MNTEKNISNTCSINISQQNFPDHKKDKGQERERKMESFSLSLYLLFPLLAPLFSFLSSLVVTDSVAWDSWKHLPDFFVGGLPLLSSPGLLRLCLINWKHHFMKENSFLIFSLFDGLLNWSFEMPELNCTKDQKEEKRELENASRGFKANINIIKRNKGWNNTQSQFQKSSIS